MVESSQPAGRTPTRPPRATRQSRKPPAFPLLGAHMSIARGFDQAVREAAAIGFTTIQVFTKNNNQWKGRPFRDGEPAAFQAALAETGLSQPISHNSYLINLASPDDALWNRSIDAMVDELQRAELLGIRDVVAHPGAHTGSGDDAGLSRIVQAIHQILDRTADLEARIALETTAGQGSCLGHRFEHLGHILDHAPQTDRLGVCVDTCHIFAAGYSLADDQGYNDTMRELDQAVGLNRVRVWHLNDSVRGLGSRVDRHAGLGRGQIGLDAFKRILNDPRFAGIPLILETPKGREGDLELDAINLQILHSLHSGAK